jgi:hypothetical protein
MNNPENPDDDPDSGVPDWHLEVANRIGAMLDAVAKRATPPAKEYPRDYVEGAAIIARIRGGPYSPDALRKSNIERIYVGREARLADEDLIAFGEELREADRRRAHPLSGSASSKWAGPGADEHGRASQRPG